MLSFTMDTNVSRHTVLSAYRTAHGWVLAQIHQVPLSVRAGHCLGPCALSWLHSGWAPPSTVLTTLTSVDMSAALLSALNGNRSGHAWNTTPEMFHSHGVGEQVPGPRMTAGSNSYTACVVKRECPCQQRALTHCLTSALQSSPQAGSGSPGLGPSWLNGLLNSLLGHKHTLSPTPQGGNERRYRITSSSSSMAYNGRCYGIQLQLVLFSSAVHQQARMHSTQTMHRL
jgi:hypothetical protein